MPRTKCVVCPLARGALLGRLRWRPSGPLVALDIKTEFVPGDSPPPFTIKLSCAAELYHTTTGAEAPAASAEPMPTTVATHNPYQRRFPFRGPPITRQEVAWLGRFQSSRRRGRWGEP